MLIGVFANTILYGVRNVLYLRLVITDIREKILIVQVSLLERHSSYCRP